MGYNAKALYIGVECKDPEVKEIKAKLKDSQNLLKESKKLKKKILVEGFFN